MSEEQENDLDQYAGSSELAEIMRAVVAARVSFPKNPRIKTLYDAVKPMMDSSMCEALLMQNAQMSNELASKRKSPLAQMLGQ